MRKGFNLIMLLCAALMVASSCSKTKSYTDMLKAEEKILDRLMDKEGIEILSEYPENGVFKENQFYELDNGVYLNVVDSGNGNRKFSNENILCRFVADVLMSDTTITVDCLTTSDSYPTSFKATYYEYYGMVVEPTSPYLSDFVSEGLASGLRYVGDSAIVKLIVPFKVSSQSFKDSGTPVYYTKVRYIYEK